MVLIQAGNHVIMYKSYGKYMMSSRVFRMILT